MFRERSILSCLRSWRRLPEQDAGPELGPEDEMDSRRKSVGGRVNFLGTPRCGDHGRMTGVGQERWQKEWC